MDWLDKVFEVADRYYSFELQKDLDDQSLEDRRFEQDRARYEIEAGAKNTSLAVILVAGILGGGLFIWLLSRD